MDTTEEAPTCSEQNIESAVAETASSDGQSEVQPIGSSLKANIDDEQIQSVSSVSGDQIMATDLASDDQPQESSGSAPESSSMNAGAEQNGKEGNDEEEMDSMSEISDFSDFSQESWHPVQGPIAWVQEQMRQGQSARSILEDLVPPGTMIPDDIDPIMMWRLIINIVSEPPKRKKLESVNTLEDVISLMKSSNKIIVLTGAGVSVSCGIPDFRSRDGVYARLAVDFPNLPDPQAMFDIHFFRSDPRPFFKFAKEIYPGQFKPSLCHHFIRLIESQGKLLRNYTQNIDTLEQEAGIERVVQCHGSFATATCTNCKLKVKADVVREDIFKQVIPKCPQCPEGTENAIMKPDIVFFGESLPEDFHKQMAQDKDECDLLIVIGSSLKVRPVALIPNSVPEHVPQILINRERLSYLNFDVELLGNCDDIVGELCHRLGTGWDQLAPPNVSPLTEVIMANLPTPPSTPQNQHSASSSPSNPTVKHVETMVTSVKNNEESLGGPSVTPEHLTSSSSKTDTASAEVKEKAEGDVKMESEQGPVSCVDCSSSKGELQITASAMGCDRGGCPGNGKKHASSCSSMSELVSSSNLPPTSYVSADKVHKEGNSAAGNALFDEVSTTTSTETKAHPRLSCDESRATDKGIAESDIVSSTSNEHKSQHQHSHHKHSHHHNQHHHHRHGHHHHHSSPCKDHHKNGNGSDTTEPIEKRPRLEEGSEASAKLASNADGDNETLTMTTGSQQTDRQAGTFDDELEEMRKMWQGRKNKVSLAQRLAENQYLFLSPNRYVFKGAEVFSDSEEDDSDSDGSSEDEETKENSGENNNDISVETEEEVEGQQVIEVCDASAGVNDVASDVPSLSKPSGPVVEENVNVKDTPGHVSSTNCEKQDCGASLPENQ